MLTTAVVVYAGVTWEAWVCLLALLPASFGVRHLLRTLQAERRHALYRWVAAEALWRRQHANAVAELETGDGDHRPSVVDGQVIGAKA